METILTDHIITCLTHTLARCTKITQVFSAIAEVFFLIFFIVSVNILVYSYCFYSLQVVYALEENKKSIAF